MFGAGAHTILRVCGGGGEENGTLKQLKNEFFAIIIHTAMFKLKKKFNCIINSTTYVMMPSEYINAHKCILLQF